MRKKRPTQNTHQAIHIVGDGQTELFYFNHLKQLMGFHCSITPCLFENNSIAKIEKKIVELLQEAVYVICAFDPDVSRRSETENHKLETFKTKYGFKDNVLFCDSLQSIEYWFLLHFEDTFVVTLTLPMQPGKSLKTQLPTDDKGRKFLENDKWVRDMIVNRGLELACERAETYSNKDPYNNVFKAVKKLR